MTILTLIKKTRRQTAMIFGSYAIVFMSFPSLIIYNNLPFLDDIFDFEIKKKSQIISQRICLALIESTVNLGIFYIAANIGVCIANRHCQ